MRSNHLQGEGSRRIVDNTNVSQLIFLQIGRYTNTLSSYLASVGKILFQVKFLMQIKAVDVVTSSFADCFLFELRIY